MRKGLVPSMERSGGEKNRSGTRSCTDVSILADRPTIVALVRSYDAIFHARRPRSRVLRVLVHGELPVLLQRGVGLQRGS